MSDRPTPETDAEHAQFAMGGFTLDFCRKLERERDEARETRERYRLEANAMMIQRDEAIADRDIARLKALESDRAHDRMVGELEGVYKERDEARDKLADWENAAAHVEADHPDEMHCGCVPVLRKLLTDARKERDEAREILREIAKASGFDNIGNWARNKAKSAIYR